MRASHQSKFVFIANPKTGSTYIRKALNPVSEVRGKRGTEIKNHWKASDIYEYFKRQGHDWFEYYSFVTIRDPFKKAVSAYIYGQNTPISVWNRLVKERPDFYDFISSDFFKDHLYSLDMVSKMNGKSIVTDVFKIEDFSNKCFSEVSKRCGKTIVLPQAKDKSEMDKLRNASPKYDYREYYSDKKSIELISRLFKSDIEFGSYSFK